IKNQVIQIRATSANKFKQQVHRQTQTPPRNSSQSSFQQPIKPYPSPKTETQYHSQNSSPSSSQNPVQPIRSSSAPKRQSQKPRKRTNTGKTVYVKPHMRNGSWVKGHSRKKPRK
ncbi:MAG: hypothetical protein ACKPB7_34200, partial [Sphaerospermopsis kisseleviana]